MRTSADKNRTSVNRITATSCQRRTRLFCATQIEFNILKPDSPQFRGHEGIYQSVPSESDRQIRFSHLTFVNLFPAVDFLGVLRQSLIAPFREYLSGLTSHLRPFQTDLPQFLTSSTAEGGPICFRVENNMRVSNVEQPFQFITHVWKPAQRNLLGNRPANSGSPGNVCFLLHVTQVHPRDETDEPLRRCSDPRCARPWYATTADWITAGTSIPPLLVDWLRDRQLTWDLFYKTI